MGPHRADLKIRFDGHLARDRVSRGQQKLIASSLVLAQLEVLRESSGVIGTLLLDDPAAELDKGRLRLLVERARRLGAQLIATATSESIAGLESPGARFHVEQGDVTRML
jgi:DNA replication and repair protein RecF